MIDDNLRKHFRGTGIQHFTREVLGRLQLPVAPQPEMQRLLSGFDELFSQTQRLEYLYMQKLASAEEISTHAGLHGTTLTSSRTLPSEPQCRRTTVQSGQCAEAIQQPNIGKRDLRQQRAIMTGNAQ